MTKKWYIKLSSLIMIVSLFAANSVMACTNFIISKGASTDGSTMITYAADSHTLYGELYFRPAKDYPAGTMFEVYEWDTGKFLGKIKQIPHTYQVVGNMNEFQLSIGETTFTGREEMQDTTSLIDYGSLIYITLQRAKNAREAIKVMSDLVNEYGYYSTGESFSIADPNEVWILEMMGRGPGKKGAVWVARRIPDGFISGHANHARISTFPLEDGKTSISSKNISKIFTPTVETVYAYDVITVAREKGFFDKAKKDAEFSFTAAYAPLEYGSIRFSDARVWAGFRKVNSTMDKYTPYIMGQSLEAMPLWIKPDKKLSVHDVMEMMRDHYEGTPLDMTQDVGAGPYKVPYRWRPMTWKVDGVEYVHERAISTQQTGFSFVAQSRGWLPNPIGGVLWFGLDDTYMTVYVPMYCGITKVPETFAQGHGSMTEFKWDAAFWVFNWVSNFTYSRYSDIIVDVRAKQAQLEMSFISELPSVDSKASELYKTNQAEALKLITDFSVNKGNFTTSTWRQFGEYLLVKYMDGNVKKEKNGKFEGNGFGQITHPHHPAYPDDWYKRIINEKGEVLKMKNLPVGK
jgi:dipeptidase